MILSLRTSLMTFGSLAALLGGPGLAHAQSTPSQDPATSVEDIIVTGTRAVGRTRLDTIAPVDVVSGEVLTRQGTGTELAAGLSAQAPSISFPRPAITDGSDHVRPATLRGLAPDQTLVLVNGVRGHVAALVNVNGNIGRGSTAFDLNTIPTVALGSVEVLRDGASAQYGADAIAGVINLRLREARSGGGLTVNYGVYDTDYTTARGDHSRSDGKQMSVAGWVGLPLLGEGFLTLSGELQKRDPTNRSDYAAASAVNGGGTTTVLGRFGDPETETGTIWYNAAVPLSGGWEAYSFGGYQHRYSEAAATARPFNDARNVAAIYPNGFTPVIGATIDDYNLYGGLRGEAAGFDWDFSVGYGRNALDYEVLNSLNASYGAASQTRFRAGDLGYDQLTLAADATRQIDAGLYEPLNLAVGVEYRRESFELGAGEPTSYNRGPLTAAQGSQGFPGFQPSNEVDVSRNNWSVFADLEGRFTEQFTVGAAVRYEDYSDFGDNLNGKLSARFDASDSFAVRGAISTGFKAPALQQQFFSYTSTNLTATTAGVQLIEAGTFRVDAPIAVALGAKPLKPETSTNFSAGFILRGGGFELTVDAYRIDIQDRIVYSENLGGSGSRAGQSAAQAAAINTFLTANFGISAARFFLNGVDTTTSGVDVVSRYRWDADAYGRFDFTLAGNFNQTEVTRQAPQPTIAIPGASLATSPGFLFDRSNLLSFEEGTPEEKFLGSVDWSLGPWGATAKVTYYDSVLVANNSATLDYSTGYATLIDLEGRYDIGRGVALAVGVNNLTDEYPNFAPTSVNGATGSVGFPSYSPYGFNGRFLYGRVSYNW